MSRLLSASFLLLFALGACTSRYAAPVNDLDATPRFVDDGRTHLVNDGETLYVVAWMYDLDFAALARHNNLREPYTVEPGQLLRVDVRNGAATPSVVASTPTPAQAAPIGTATTTAVAVGTGIQRAPLESQPITRQELPSATPLPSTPAPSPSTAPPPSTTPAPVPTPPPQTARVETPVPQAPIQTPVQEPPPVIREPAVAAPSVQTPPPSAPVDPNAPIRWDWPARGNIIGRYSDSDPDNKGIKLGGNVGDTVMAAADGEVVYTGNGLLRYGELVILKHNDRFLSAYAHNKLITVKEGDRVTRGQKIAELGSTGIDRDMLHFEIRLDGKPVDPMTYLPSR